MRKVQSKAGLLAAIVVGVFRALPAPSWAQATAVSPAVTFADQALEVAGISPGGTVVWFTVARSAQEYQAHYMRRHGAAVANAQGQVEIALPEAVAPQSIWVVADLATGAYALASPPSFSPLRFDLSQAAVNVGENSVADQIVDPVEYSEILLVRPGQGAWGKAVGRGGADDESNPGDPAIRLSLNRLLPVVAGPSGQTPTKLMAGDVLFVVHPQAMAVAAETIGAQP